MKTQYPDDALVVLYQSGVWMGICKDGIAADTARVVCRHFGLPEYELNNFFIENFKKIIK